MILTMCRRSGCSEMMRAALGGPYSWATHTVGGSPAAGVVCAGGGGVAAGAGSDRVRVLDVRAGLAGCVGRCRVLRRRRGVGASEGVAAAGGAPPGRGAVGFGAVGVVAVVAAAGGVSVHSGSSRARGSASSVRESVGGWEVVVVTWYWEVGTHGVGCGPPTPWVVVPGFPPTAWVVVSAGDNPCPGLSSAG